MQASAFILTKNGYRVLQHNVKDYDAIANSRHGDHQTSFIENKSEVKPKFQQNNGPNELILRSHIYGVKFLNSNPAPIVIKEKLVGGIRNFFIGNDTTKWAVDVKSYQSVTFKNMYPNIDVRYYTDNARLKYDIIVHPGGDVNKVILIIDGAEGLSVKNGALQIKTSVGVLQENIPYSYQINSQGKKEMNCTYEVRGNLVKFKLDKAYDRSSTLVIDPVPTFISYSGSTAENWGFTATYDKAGHLYAGGIVFGNSIPFTNGSFQNRFQGGTVGTPGNGYDMGILKFKPDGSQLVYATYIGGGGNEQPHSLVADNAGNLIIVGRTNSNDYPTGTSLKTFGPCGDYDIAVTKLSADGKTLIGSVKIGGANYDGVNIQPNYEGGNSNPGSISIRRNYGDDARSEVILDKDENILLASVTQSTDFPTKNAFQNSHGAASSSTTRMQDGVLIKLNRDLSDVIFSSYLGGNNDDAAFVLAINPIDDNIYVAGATASTDLPAKSNDNNVGGTLTNPLNLIDGFISIISSDGLRIINTRYIGTPLIDVIYGIQFDKNGFPYIAGTSTGVMTPINSPYNANSQFLNQDRGKQFVGKLQPDLSQFIYRTIFGSEDLINTALPNLSITAFMVDRCENIYISGWGGRAFGYQGVGGMKGMPLSTADPKNPPYQQNTDGQDFYFFVLGRNAEKLLYASYFGQTGGFPDHVDGGTSRFDPNGQVYQTICSCRRDDPISQLLFGFPFGTVHASIKGSADCNLLAIKFNMNVNQVFGGLKTSINGVAGATNGCAPLTVVFSDTLDLATNYRWDFGDGSIQGPTTSPTISHEFTTPGVYRVKMIANDPNSCNIDDESFVTINVGANKAVLKFDNEKQLPCTDLIYEFINQSQANDPFSNDAFLWDFGDGITAIYSLNDKVLHKYDAPGTYKVTLKLLDSKFCNFNETKEESINIAINVIADFIIPNSACVDKPVKFANISAAGRTYLWTLDDGSSSTISSPEFTFTKAGKITGTLEVVNNNTCNMRDVKPFEIDILPNPIANFTYTPNPTEPNTPVAFINNSIGADKYEWKFGDGGSFSTSNINANVRHLYNETKTYNACLDAINNAGCVTTYCEPISVTINPGFNVPNAFSPNGDGVNDKIFVRGFGITKMTWKIYNRWGNLIFISNSIADGWDGKYNGKLQPQEVYHYTLELEFSDKEKATKKGDITLLR
jgi:gliding motility-associated-like protein